MSQPRPSRRALLGASAWAAPVIVVASAAPAIAGSTNNITASFSVGKNSVNGTVTVGDIGTILNTTGAVRSVAVQVSITADPGTGDVVASSNASNGWTAGTSTSTSASRTRNYTKDIPIGSSQLPTLSVSFNPATATGAVFVRITPPTGVAAVDPDGQRF